MWLGFLDLHMNNFVIQPARQNIKYKSHNLSELRAEVGAFFVSAKLSCFWMPGRRHIEFIFPFKLVEKWRMHDNEFLLNVSFYGDKLRVFLTKKLDS